MSIWMCETSCQSRPYSMEYPTCAPKFQWPRLAEYAGAAAAAGTADGASGGGTCAIRTGRDSKLHPTKSEYAANFSNVLCTRPRITLPSQFDAVGIELS